MSTGARTLSTADERREAVLAAALPVIAAKGLHAAPTLEIARGAGISQAYLFRLFPTKVELAVAVVERVNERIRATFAEAAQQARAAGGDVVEGMGHAYVELLRDRELILAQLHAQAASSDLVPVRDAMRAGFERLVAEVELQSGAPPEEVKRFFAHGMLLNVMAAIDAEHAEGHWRDVLVGAELGAWPVDGPC